MTCVPELLLQCAHDMSHPVLLACHAEVAAYKQAVAVPAQLQ